ncbi:hypothetical protein D9758_005291 [Tetrapyrgos nigripes]|uniref:Uncharacterized protein n=1 Tax=Tetrapyrgos nigripes TaxID=182062 RepID=A0A8H5GX13_9AGAR|nr:hypothetical protein D9758_005291 [Tetrapyrgos nigripes]
MGFANIHVSKAGAIYNHAHRLQSRAESSCLTGGFYKTPTAGQKIDALYPLNITWDTSCLSPANDKADIYLFAPNSNTPRLHMYEGITFSSGSYNATLKPRWWNSTSSEQLQLLIIQHGDAPFLATLPGGPTFSATYQAPSSGTPDVADITKASGSDSVTQVDAKTEPASSHRGKIAAAVLVPLLALIALGIFAYLKISRTRGKEKRAAYAENIDKRMSTISTDWKSMSAAGAQAAIRQSMAISGEGNPRASSFSFGAIRPSSSVYSTEGHGQAGVGVPVPQMVEYQRTPGVGLRSSAHSNALAASRVSRVSFADSPARPRPSGESRRSAYERRSQAGQSRAFHFSAEDEPPMPEGAAERASMFVGGINPALVRAANNHPSLTGLTRLNTSTTTVNTSRLSRFDEVYGEGDATRDSVYAAYGAYAYSGHDDDEISGAISPQQQNGPHALTEEDVGPALSNVVTGVGRQAAVGVPALGLDVGVYLSLAQSVSRERKGRAAVLQFSPLFPLNIFLSSLVIRTHDEENARLPSFPTPVHYEYSQTSPGTSNWTGNNETLFTASPITPGFPALSFSQAMSRTASNDSSAPAESTLSPISSGMMAPPVQGMSPDDMLRAYAERRTTVAGSRTGTPVSELSQPARALSPSAPGVYSPTRGAYGASGFDE